MAQTELEEIKTYWTNKYPRVDILLWKHDNDPKYYGRLQHMESSTQFSCDTIGELIGQGEAFLRTL